MIARFNRLIILFLIIGVALFITLKNRAEIPLYLGESLQYRTSVGVLLLSSFGSGILLTALVALLYSMKGYFRERALRNRLNDSAIFFERAKEARVALATGQGERAFTLWDALIPRDLSHIIAHCEAALAQESVGETDDAIRELEIVSSNYPKETEPKIHLARLYEKIGNKTAALDMTSAANVLEPSASLSRKAMQLAESLERIPEALRYAQLLHELTGTNQSDIGRLAAKEVLQLSLPPEEEKNRLLVLAKKYPQNAEVFLGLARVTKKLAEPQDAAQYYVKAARASTEEKATLSIWRELIGLWHREGLPDRATAAIRSMLQELKSAEAQLIGIESLLEFNRLDEAKEAIDTLRRTGPSSEVRRSLLALEGWYNVQRGDVRKAAELWNTYREHLE